MRRILMLCVLASSAAAVGCNVLAGRCDCTHDPYAPQVPTSGPSYPVVNHAAPNPGAAAPMPIPVAPTTPQPMPEPTNDLPKLPNLPE